MCGNLTFDEIVWVYERRDRKEDISITRIRLRMNEG